MLFYKQEIEALRDELVYSGVNQTTNWPAKSIRELWVLTAQVLIDSLRTLCFSHKRVLKSL